MKSKNGSENSSRKTFGSLVFAVSLKNVCKKMKGDICHHDWF